MQEYVKEYQKKPIKNRCNRTQTTLILRQPLHQQCFFDKLIAFIITFVYNICEVINTQFVPFIYSENGNKVSVNIIPMTEKDALSTIKEPIWQTSWLSDFITDNSDLKFAVKNADELIALVVYEVLESILAVRIVYMEAQPQSNPVLCNDKKYNGIGKLLIAFGIKLSIDNGFNGDVLLEAKTTELAEHYKRDFHAVQLPVFDLSAPRFLISDETAEKIFFDYLE